MRARAGLSALMAFVAVVVGPVATASAAPYDDCKGLRMVCVFQDPNHGGMVVWTAVEDGTYNTSYRTRTLGTNVVNFTSSWVRVKQYKGSQVCQVSPGGDITLGRPINDNIGQIVIGNWSESTRSC
jgi:hypothetical protein